MKSTVRHLFHWFGEALTHALGTTTDRHLEPPPIGMQPFRDVPDKRARDFLSGCVFELQQIGTAEATGFRRVVGTHRLTCIEIRHGAGDA